MRTSAEAPAKEPRILSDAEPGANTGHERPAAEPIELRAVGHRFGSLEVIETLDAEVGAGEVVGLVGPSGCGKSTLLELISGLAAPASGAIRVGAGASEAQRLDRCAYMPQRDLLLPWLTALDNAALAPRNRGASRAEAAAAAAPLFARFGLAGFEHVRPAELSGGMRQRVAFLRTLLAGKPAMLLDEPFASLDAITRAEMQEWLAGALAAERRTVVLVSHDVEEALYLCDRVLVLSSRPARVVAELAVEAPRAHPRDHAVSEPAFVAVREQALDALREGRR